MSKKRKITVAVISVVILLFAASIFSLARRNYSYGEQLRNEASRMSIQFYQLVDAITHLEANVTEGRETLGGDRLAYDSAMSGMKSYFGSDDAPFTAEVRSKWIDEIEAWEKQTEEDSGIISIFNDEVRRSEFIAFKNDLNATATKLDYVFERYQHMTTFERYISNWRLEQRLLSESAALNTHY